MYAIYIQDPIVVEKEGRQGNRSNLLACPICYDSLSWNAGPGLSVYVYLCLAYSLCFCMSPTSFCFFIGFFDAEIRFVVPAYNVVPVRKSTLGMKHILISQQLVEPKYLANSCQLPLNYSGFKFVCLLFHFILFLLMWIFCYAQECIVACV